MTEGRRRTCVILQPSYVPWRGYFHQIRKADVFVFYDDVQYDDGGWRNRNRLKTANGTRWLTIPVRARGAQTEGTLIKDIPICWDRPWPRKHWATIEQSYRRAPFFDLYAGMVRSFYDRRDSCLADFTIDTTITLAGALGASAHTRFVRSSTLNIEGSRMERLVGILDRVGASHYISGPSASAYIDEQALAERGMTVEYMTYEYGEYPQVHPPFDPHVSVLDLLFMAGPEAGRHVWGADA